jgi:hypothetical protein
MRRPNWKLQQTSAAGFELAFTIPEYLVTVAIGTIIMGVMLGAYLFGARMHALASVKLGTSEEARMAVQQITHDVRTASSFKIGTGSLTSFTATGPNQRRQGNAIQIYKTTDTNFYTRYFLDSDNCLKRITNDTTAAYVLASSLTNAVVFKAEDPWGNVTTNERPSEIVGLTMQFSRRVFQGKTTNRVDAYNDYFQLSAKINKRVAVGYQY